MLLRALRINAISAAGAPLANLRRVVVGIVCEEIFCIRGAAARLALVLFLVGLQVCYHRWCVEERSRKEGKVSTEDSLSKRMN